MSIKSKMFNEKTIYEFLSFCYVVFLYLSLYRYFESFWFVLMAIPMGFLITISLILMPILMKRENTGRFNIKDRMEQFYLFTSFFLLGSIIYMVIRW